MPAVGVRVRLAEVASPDPLELRVGGYWVQPEHTAEAVVDGWLKTGDSGDIDEYGYATITDREKDVIITGGENVSSIEVEDCLYQHPAVAEVAVIGVPDPKWGE